MHSGVINFTNTTTGYTPTLGCPIEAPTTIKVNVVKLIEYYERPNGPIVIERLCWKFGTQLFPYKARYINLDREYDDRDILFLQNVKAVQDKISGHSINFSSPIKYYFDTTIAPWYDPELNRFVSYLYQKYQNWIDAYAYSQDKWDETEKFMSMLDSRGKMEGDEERFKHFILPNPTLHDPYTINNYARSLNTRDLVFEKPLGNLFDTSHPTELIINHPDKTLYSPREAHGAIVSLEQIASQYTDVNLEYILSGAAVIKVVEKYCVSRYRDKLFHNIEIDVRWIIINDVISLLYYKTNNIKFMEEIRVSFIMSYGEEVLIEVYHLNTNEHLGSIHFDLAMLALCVPNIAVDVGHL